MCATMHPAKKSTLMVDLIGITGTCFLLLFVKCHTVFCLEPGFGVTWQTCIFIADCSFFVRYCISIRPICRITEYFDMKFLYVVDQ